MLHRSAKGVEGVPGRLAGGPWTSAATVPWPCPATTGALDLPGGTPPHGILPDLERRHTRRCQPSTLQLWTGILSELKAMRKLTDAALQSFVQQPRLPNRKMRDSRHEGRLPASLQLILYWSHEQQQGERVSGLIGSYMHLSPGAH